MKDFRREMADKVIKECNLKLIEYTSDSSQIPMDAYNPIFTESDFDAIDAEAKEKTSGYNEVETGLTFKKSESIPYYHIKNHVEIVAKNISDRLSNEIIPKIIDNVVNYVTKCTEIYRTKLTEHKQELESEYQKLLVDKENNDKLHETIKDMEVKLKIVKAGESKVNELKGELENYVG